MSDYDNIVEFTARLRKIEGLRLFHIFSKYVNSIYIERLFNILALYESEETLRELEGLWEEFMEEKKQAKQD